jgi:hypothetical protein
MSDIKIITFKTNQSIIGDVSEQIMNKVKISKPVQLIVIPPRSANDPGGVGFAPFLQYAEEFATGMFFSMDDILIITTPVVDLRNQYNEVFGSGIQIASSIPKL